MEWKYMRIQGREDSWVTKYPKGIFGMCWRMIMDGQMEPEDEKEVTVEEEIETSRDAFTKELVKGSGAHFYAV